MKIALIQFDIAWEDKDTNFRKITSMTENLEPETDLIVLPEEGPLFNPLLATLPLQLLSYRLSLARGSDPDFPRNLSKTLTVD